MGGVCTLRLYWGDARWLESTETIWFDLKRLFKRLWISLVASSVSGTNARSFSFHSSWFGRFFRKIVQLIADMVFDPAVQLTLYFNIWLGKFKFPSSAHAYLDLYGRFFRFFVLKFNLFVTINWNEIFGFTSSSSCLSDKLIEIVARNSF